MNWQDTLYRWEMYSEKLYPLRDDIADIFKSKCFYDDNWVYHKLPYIADDDTVFLLKLSVMLNNICCFIEEHIKILQQRVDLDEEARANQMQAFECWKRGLCPRLMQSVPRYVTHDCLNPWETYDEIAAFLNDRTINYEATQNAIHSWELSRSVLKVA